MGQLSPTGIEDTPLYEDRLKRLVPIVDALLTVSLVAYVGLQYWPLPVAVVALAGISLLQYLVVRVHFKEPSILEDKHDVTVNSIRPESTLVRFERLLDQGRYEEASALVSDLAHDKSLAASIARARLALGRGDARAAQSELAQTTDAAQAEKKSKAGRMWFVYQARAFLRLGAELNFHRLFEEAMGRFAVEAVAARQAEALAAVGLESEILAA